MHCAARVPLSFPAAGAAPLRRGRRLAAWLLAAGLLLLALLPADAAPLTLSQLRAERDEEGLQLSFVAGFTLPRPVEDALLKGVPLHFIAEARLYRPRWYWRDIPVAEASRQWRLAYQPLTRRYRVAFGSLGQNYDSLAAALAAVQRTVHWKIAEPDAFGSSAGHYLELSYRLDTSQLPRPFQFGIGGQADWQLSDVKTLRLEDALR